MLTLEPKRRQVRHKSNAHLSSPATRRGPANTNNGAPLFLQRRAIQSSQQEHVQNQGPEEHLNDEALRSASPRAIQPKLIVGPSNDDYEREADHVAKRAQRMPDTGVPASFDVEDEALLQGQSKSIQTKSLTPPYLQRRCVECNEGLEQQAAGAGLETIQTKPASGAEVAPSSNVSKTINSHSGGSPLPGNVRAKSESVLGRDLSHVQIHSDSNAHRAARELGAKAFTHQNHIWLGVGQSVTDESLIAHEATHVVQQQESDVSPAIQRQQSPGGGLREPDMGSVTFRMREDGTIEIVAGAPEAPGVGALGFGARRNPDGSWTPVFGQDPATGATTYSWEEILELLRGSIGTGPTSPTQPGLTGPTLPPDLEVPAPRLELTPPTLRVPSHSLSLTNSEFGVIDHFEFNKADFPDTDDARAEIARLARLINAHPEAEVHIEGHTDSVGEPDINVMISLQRAETIKAQLIAGGVVNPGRLTTRGYGETQLMHAEERTDVERAENRRVEVHFMLPPGTRGESFRLRLE